MQAVQGIVPASPGRLIRLVFNTSNKKNETHTYTAGGQYVVTLTATNSQGLTDNTSITVTIPEEIQQPIETSEPAANN